MTSWALGGDWIRVGTDYAALNIEDRDGQLWSVSADRNGSWRVRRHPSRYDDDERVYAEGHVDLDDTMPMKLRFTAAKKAARKYLTDLLRTLAEEGK